MMKQVIEKKTLTLMSVLMDFPNRGIEYAKKNDLYETREEWSLLSALDDVHIDCKTRHWSNTACGWGGIAGQAFTKKEVIAVIVQFADPIAFVYIGRYAYTCAADEEFYKLMNDNRLPGHAHLEESSLTIIHKA